MKNMGSTPILTNLVGVHPRNIHTKFEAKSVQRFERRSRKTKKVHAEDNDNDNNDDNGHSLIARVTLTH